MAVKKVKISSTSFKYVPVKKVQTSTTKTKKKR